MRLMTSIFIDADGLFEALLGKIRESLAFIGVI